MSPPTESIWSAICWAVRVGVPLNSMCSMTCEMPRSLVGLVTRPHPDPDAQRHRLDIGDVFGDDADTVGKHFALYHNGWKSLVLELSS